MIHGMIAGNIGGDAEIRQTQDGQSVCSFSVASSSKVKGNEVTTWVRCSMWGKRGEALSKFLIKGAKVSVVGALSMRSYEKNGETKTSLECRVDDVALMGGKNDGGERKQERVEENETPDEAEFGF
jgi:single-strand DNA-binding protein